MWGELCDAASPTFIKEILRLSTHMNTNPVTTSMPTDALLDTKIQPTPMIHLPVILSEATELLEPYRGGVFIDATLGLGGHSEALLTQNPGIRLYGIDQDAEARALAKARLGERITIIPGNFRDISTLSKQAGVTSADGILLDIGVSSLQLDDPQRGFTFREEGPLDMRMDQETGETAADIVNTLKERDLADLIFKYGEERLSRKIARMLVEKRPFTTTTELAEVLVQAYPLALRHKRPHPATRTFQALRIAVNDELGALEQGLDGALELLAPGGILAVITFHSLEDRIVKYRFRAAAENGFKILTKRPTTPSAEEMAINPRSRSAKLRGIQRVS